MNDKLSVSNNLQTNYDNYYDGESEWRWLSAIDKVNNIVTLSSKYPHKTILEIGSGEGSVLKRLSDLQFGDALYSLEISETALKTIRNRNIKSLAALNLFNGYSIPYENKKFDLCILSHVIEHLEYPRKVLFEAGRVANYVYVEVPLEDNRKLQNDFQFDKVGHINAYSPKTIRRLVQTCDLEILSQTVTNPSYKIYEYQFGRKGIIKYISKELMLRFLPSIATNLWSYHSAIICKGSV